jgi:hypothetical protein
MNIKDYIGDMSDEELKQFKIDAKVAYDEIIAHMGGNDEEACYVDDIPAYKYTYVYYHDPYKCKGIWDILTVADMDDESVKWYNLAAENWSNHIERIYKFFAIPTDGRKKPENIKVLKQILETLLELPPNYVSPTAKILFDFWDTYGKTASPGFLNSTFK